MFYLISGVDIGALAEKKFNETGVAVGGCRVQRRTTGGVGRRQQRRRAAQQQTGNGAVAADARQMQRRQALHNCTFN